MNNRLSLTVSSICVLITFILSACGAGTPAATPTSTNTSTPVPPTHTPTATITPTKTSTPTATPNLTATQQHNELQSVVQKYFEAGILPSLDGNYQVMGDYADSLTEANVYEWDFFDKKIVNFIIRADIVLDESQAKSGCGFAFGSSATGLNQFVVLSRGGSTEFGTYGRTWVTRTYNGALDYPPAFTMTLLVYENELRLLINDDEVLMYRYVELERDALGPAVFSGSKPGEETRCVFSNMVL